MDFQQKVLQQLGHLEAEVKGIKAELKGGRDLLGERCANRSNELKLLWLKYDNLKKRIDLLEQFEQRRKGGIVVILALLTAAGALGGFLVKVLPSFF